MVHYKENSDNEKGMKFDLIVNDGAMHETIMRAMLGTIRMAVQCHNSSMFENDLYNIVTMVEMLDAMLPDEYQLEHGIEYSEEANKKRIAAGF